MKELVLTGFAAFWPKSLSDAVFLGPWCFADNKHCSFFDQESAIMAPSPWKTWDDVLNASELIGAFADSFSVEFSENLDRALGVNKGFKYWYTVSRAWLIHWLGIVWDRYTRLKYFDELMQGETAYKINIFGAGEKKRQFYGPPMEYLTHRDNLILFSDILRAGEWKSFELQEQEYSEEKSINPANEGWASRFIKYLRLIFSDHLPFGNIYGASYAELIRFFIKCNGFKFPIFSSDTRMFDEGKIKWSSSSDEFSNIVKKIISRHIPEPFFTITGAKGHRNGVWLGSTEIYQYSGSKKIAALKLLGWSIIGCQHGAGYGQTLSFPIGHIEYKVNDFFLTWGWSIEKNFPSMKFFPMPSPMLSKMVKRRKEGPVLNNIVFISTSHPAYCYRLHSVLFPEHFVEFIKRKASLINLLSRYLKAKIIYKPYFNDYGTGELEYLREHATGYVLSSPASSFGALIEDAWLLVFDHPGAGFLQAVSARIPTFLLIGPEFFRLKDNCMTSDLVNVGIAHFNLSSLEDRLKKLNGKVHAWWWGDEVQQCLDNYCHIFARRSESWKTDWFNLLSSIKKKHGSE